MDWMPPYVKFMSEGVFQYFWGEEKMLSLKSFEFQGGTLLFNNCISVVRIKIEKPAGV